VEHPHISAACQKLKIEGWGRTGWRARWDLEGSGDSSMYIWEWEEEEEEGKGWASPTADASPFSETVAAVDPAKNCTINVPINSPATAGVSVGLFLERLSMLYFPALPLPIPRPRDCPLG
jgi:hypothetical protein